MTLLRFIYVNFFVWISGFIYEKHTMVAGLLSRLENTLIFMNIQHYYNQKKAGTIYIYIYQFLHFTSLLHLMSTSGGFFSSSAPTPPQSPLASIPKHLKNSMLFVPRFKPSFVISSYQTGVLVQTGFLKGRSSSNGFNGPSTENKGMNHH